MMTERMKIGVYGIPPKKGKKTYEPYSDMLRDSVTETDCQKNSNLQYEADYSNLQGSQINPVLAMKGNGYQYQPAKNNKQRYLSPNQTHFLSGTENTERLSKKVERNTRLKEITSGTFPHIITDKKPIGSVEFKAFDDMERFNELGSAELVQRDLDGKNMQASFMEKPPLTLQASKLPIIGKSNITAANIKKKNDSTGDNFTNIKDYFTKYPKNNSMLGPNNTVDNVQNKKGDDLNILYSQSTISLENPAEINSRKTVQGQGQPIKDQKEPPSPVKTIMKRLNPNLIKQKANTFVNNNGAVEDVESLYQSVAIIPIKKSERPPKLDHKYFRQERKQASEPAKYLERSSNHNSPTKRRGDVDTSTVNDVSIVDQTKRNNKDKMSEDVEDSEGTRSRTVDPHKSSVINNEYEGDDDTSKDKLLVKKEATPRTIIKKIAPQQKAASESVPQKGEKSNIVAERATKRLQEFIQSNKQQTNDKDAAILLKISAYKEFLNRISFSFCLHVKPPNDKTFLPYKYYLCKGNNSLLIKQLMKQRWWWCQVENKDVPDINFMWTQIRQNQFVSLQKSKKKSQLEAIENSTISVNANDETKADSLTEGSESDTDSETKKLGSFKRSGRSSTSTSRPSAGKSVGKGKETVAKPEEKKDGTSKLFTEKENALYNSATSNGKKTLENEDYEALAKAKKSNMFQCIQDSSTLKVSNHLEDNYHLGNKKALLYNMRNYYDSLKQDVFNYLPLTFHIRNGLEDKEFQNFVDYFNKKEKEIQEQEDKLAEEGKKKSKANKNVWIVKPGENTNRGNGIHVCNEIQQIKELISSPQNANAQYKRTYLIQQYLDKPLLYNKRKFDMRCYVLLASVNGIMRGYWYQEGYIRTSSKEFTLKNVTNRLIHLTNDAIQKKGEEYGRFENGNKVSFPEMSKYLNNVYEGKVSFENDIYPQLKSLATDTIRCAYTKIDPQRREHGFEIFGLDFMIDANFKAWLIEVNTNPDINTCCPHLTRVIPPMVENALKIALDPLFPPPTWPNAKKSFAPENVENNKFELVFDEVEDGPALKNTIQPENLAMDLIFEDEEEEEVASDHEDT